MCMCVCCAEEEKKQEENSQEDEEASISFLEPWLPSHDIIYAKQAVVARGDFRELPLLRLIYRIHQGVIIVHDKVSLVNRRK